MGDGVHGFNPTEVLRDQLVGGTHLKGWLTFLKLQLLIAVFNDQELVTCHIFPSPWADFYLHLTVFSHACFNMFHVTHGGVCIKLAFHESLCIFDLMLNIG